MGNDFEALARALLATQQGKQMAAVKGLEQLNALLRTPDGQRLLTLISQGGADTLKAAANAALQGDENAAKRAIAQLLSTREGAMLAARLMELMNRK